MALLASWHRERDVISECFVIGTPSSGRHYFFERLRIVEAAILCLD